MKFSPPKTSNSRSLYQLPPTELEAIAPAKINLALLVGGRRSNGLHRLASLVVFSEFGDRVRIGEADRLSLEVSGTHKAGVPTDGSNLAMKAASLMADGRGVRILLEKRIPAAAGLGGGSSDAATVLRLLSRLWNEPLPSHRLLMDLGADIPACIVGSPVFVEGAGELVAPAGCVPGLSMLLVNPGVQVATGAVFDAFAGTGTPNLELPPDHGSEMGFHSWLAAQRNDLEEAAIGLEPAITEVLREIRQLQGCRLARMSGSGATCFGVFADPILARAAARKVRTRNPGWWALATSCRPSPSRASAVSGDGEA